MRDRRDRRVLKDFTLADNISCYHFDVKYRICYWKRRQEWCMAKNCQEEGVITGL